ncbi:MAG: hypothetical protein R2844_19555 [Caldilineales bacterium]
MVNGVMTGTGDTYEDIAMATNILVVTGISPSHGPQSGPGATQSVTVSGRTSCPAATQQ